MPKIACLFPGQGSQYIGMGQELATRYPQVRRYFDVASEALGFDLSRLCWEGPEESLAETANQQPAILTVSAACLALLAEEGIGADVVAGLSLGEYSALIAAGALSFEAAVPLVWRRGTYMQEAVPLGVGAMAAILGLEAVQVDQLCTQVRAETHLVVEGANYNCPGQIAISGHCEAVERVMALAAEMGHKSVKLPVTAPFHCQLLHEVGDLLKKDLESVQVKPARIPVVSNVTADYMTEPDEIRSLLVRQVFSPVRWEESIRRMIADGVETFIEVGPARKLSGFMKRINKGLQVLNIEDSGSLGKVLASCGRVC